MTSADNNDGYEDGRRRVGRTVRMRAPAKVNLHLEVLRRRHDDYHEIETILQAVGIFDEVEVTLEEQWRGGEPSISLEVESGDPTIPDDETNLCWKAARLFCRARRVSGRLSILLRKEIPAAAGLGGGSSDAAAVLVACDRLFGTGCGTKELQDIAAALGADVPFFVEGGTALGRGTGTRLTPLPRLGACRFLIVKPALDLRTQDVYGGLKLGLTVNSPKANIGVIKPLLTRFPQRTWPGFNRLEDVVLPSHPVLQRLVMRMRESAPVAMLSGSGSALFGCFEPDEDLSGIMGEIAASCPFVRTAEPFAGGVEVRED